MTPKSYESIIRPHQYFLKGFKDLKPNAEITLSMKPLPKSFYERDTRARSLKDQMFSTPTTGIFEVEIPTTGIASTMRSPKML
jgi:hypothetical protein